MGNFSVTAGTRKDVQSCLRVVTMKVQQTKSGMKNRGEKVGLHESHF